MAGNVFLTKEALRKEAEGRRRAFSPEEVERRSSEVNRHLASLPLLEGKQIHCVALYDAQSFEISLNSLAAQLGSRGVRCAYPRVEKPARELGFFTPGANEWIRGPFGIREPSPLAPRCAITDVDVFVVPGVAFSRQGHRLGRGKGYYDATLALRRRDAVIIGVTFDCTVFDAVPSEAHDVSVDWLATETGCVASSRSQ